MTKEADIFLQLLKNGLWPSLEFDRESLAHEKDVDWRAVYGLARGQSVTGIVLAGVESLRSKDRANLNIPETQLLQWIGEVQILERRNKEMNRFVALMVEKLRDAGVCTVLVKGQGVAQCYEHPLWRSCGDVDLLFDADGYEKAKAFLVPLAASVDGEDKRKKHLGMVIDSWTVELHGLMPTQISKQINRGVWRVQQDVFENGGVRVWTNEGTEVLLPSPDDDAVFVFTHFLQHFFVGGVGLRQICDWCRLLWTYRDVIDRDLLGRRLREMGITSEWRAFGAFAVLYLGMPVEAMPFFTHSASHGLKAERICRAVLEAGDLGYNKDAGYHGKYPKLVENGITLWKRLGEFCRLTMIFPIDAPQFFWTYVKNRIEAAMQR